jgi:hypothetical protein
MSSRKESSMKVFGKLLIGMAAALMIVACLAVTMLAAKVYRHLSLNDRNENHATGWDNLGIPHDFGVPGNSDELPGIARVARFGDTEDDDDLAEAREAVIDAELRDSTPEEREIWKTELNGRSPEAAREILSLRRKMSAAPPSTAGSVELTAADAPPSEPQRLPDTGVSPAQRGPADALRLIESAIEATDAAEQAILNNITSELAELRRMREQLKTLRQLHAELSPAT